MNVLSVQDWNAAGLSGQHCGRQCSITSTKPCAAASARGGLHEACCQITNCRILSH